MIAMMKTPDEVLKWTDLDFTTGDRILRSDAPEDVKKSSRV